MCYVSLRSLCRWLSECMRAGEVASPLYCEDCKVWTQPRFTVLYKCFRAFRQFFCVCVPILLSHVKDTGIDYYKYGLSAKREVRLYGPKRSQGPETPKNERGQYPAILTEQAWSCDELHHNNRPPLTKVTTVSKDFWGTFCRGTRRVIRAGKKAPSCMLG